MGDLMGFFLGVIISACILIVIWATIDDDNGPDAQA